MTSRNAGCSGSVRYDKGKRRDGRRGRQAAALLVPALAAVLIWTAAVMATPVAKGMAHASPRLPIVQIKLTPVDKLADAYFGQEVVLDGTTALVAAPGCHAVYVYGLSKDRAWTRQATLTTADTDARDSFGASIALDGDTAVIGADCNGSSTEPGFVYIFTRSGTIWSQQQRIVAADGVYGDQFGTSVAVDGDTCIVGSPYADPEGMSAAGAVYVFTRSVSTWTQQTRLVADDSAAGARFGCAVELDTGTALIGSYAASPGAVAFAGAAYVFTGSGASWTQQTELTASDKGGEDVFGSDVALDGDTAVVTAPMHASDGVRNAGAAYVYRRSGTAWTEEAELVASDKAEDDYAGSVDLDGETVVLGTLMADPDGVQSAGAAYVFTRTGTSWTQWTKLTAADKASTDQYGTGAVDAGRALVGARCVDVDGVASAGAVYASVIDTASPRAIVKSRTVKQAQARAGTKLAVRVTLKDKQPSCGSAAVLVSLISRSGKKLSSVRVRGRATNTTFKLNLKLKKSLKKGTYYLLSRATDSIGHRQRGTAMAKLTVR